MMQANMQNYGRRNALQMSSAEKLKGRTESLNFGIERDRERDREMEREGGEMTDRKDRAAQREQKTLHHLMTSATAALLIFSFFSPLVRTTLDVKNFCIFRIRLDSRRDRSIELPVAAAASSRWKSNKTFPSSGWPRLLLLPLPAVMGPNMFRSGSTKRNLIPPRPPPPPPPFFRRSIYRERFQTDGRIS